MNMEPSIKGAENMIEQIDGAGSSFFAAMGAQSQMKKM
jgi:hypothetical protein